MKAIIKSFFVVSIAALVALPAAYAQSDQTSPNSNDASPLKEAIDSVRKRAIKNVKSTSVQVKPVQIQPIDRVFEGVDKTRVDKEAVKKIRTRAEESTKVLPKPLLKKALRRSEKARVSFKKAFQERLNEQRQFRKEMLQRVAQKREELKDEVEARRKAFREKISKIKDEQKRKIAEHLQERLNFLNQRLTDHYLQYLDHLELIMDKIEARAASAEERGADVSDVRAKLTEARSEIDRVRNLVIEQKAKEYIVTIESLETLGRDYRAVVEEFRSDHKAIREELRGLKEEVRAAFQAMASALKALGTTKQAEEQEEKQGQEEAE